MRGARSGSAHRLRGPIGERCDIGKLGWSGELYVFGNVCLAKQQHVQQRCDERHLGWQRVDDGKCNACCDR